MLDRMLCKREILQLTTILQHVPWLLNALSPYINMPKLSVFRTNKIGKGLWLAFVVVHPVSMCIVAVVIMAVGIFSRTNIIHSGHLSIGRSRDICVNVNKNLFLQN
jgi:hypothetical protein